MAAEPKQIDSEKRAVTHATGRGRSLADAMPRLMLDAHRVAATIIHGLHGRRRAGAGENFWQFRRFVSGEAAHRIDWRRSARDEHLYVREREWEASHTIWIWADRSPSMDFVSSLARDSKLERSLVLAFALAEVLVQGGERVGIPGLMRPTASRDVIERMAEAMLHDPATRHSLPPDFAPAPLSEVVILSDLWSPLADTAQLLGRLAAAGAHGHLVQIVDPAEESFPYSGRIEFVEPEGRGTITAGRAETWRNDYQALLERHRAGLRAEAARRGWSFIIHRTDRGAGDVLLGLHARMGAGITGTGITSAGSPGADAPQAAS
jgi:uncharacterized protein (DUF58 family)